MIKPYVYDNLDTEVWEWIDYNGKIPNCRPDLGRCWYWLRGVSGNCYLPKYKINIAAYRIVYEVLVGEIPEGYDIDHLCMVAWCVNPEHLEPVTRAENIRRWKEAHSCT